MVLTMTEGILFQSDSEKQTKNQFSEKSLTTRQILKQKFHDASYFGLKKIQRVRLWIKIFSIR